MDHLAFHNVLYVCIFLQIVFSRFWNQIYFSPTATYILKNQFAFRIRTFEGMMGFYLCYYLMFSALFYLCAQLIYHVTSVYASEHIIKLSFSYDPPFQIFLTVHLQILQFNYIYIILSTLFLRSTGPAYYKNFLVTL